MVGLIGTYIEETGDLIATNNDQNTGFEDSLLLNNSTTQYVT